MSHVYLKICLLRWKMKYLDHSKWNTASLSYLSDFAKARGVNGSVLGDGHCVPALILGRSTATWCVWPSSSSWTSSTHPASWASSWFLLRDEGLLHLHLLPVLFQLCLFVDLVDGFRALVTSPGHPVVLRWGRGRAEVAGQKLVTEKIIHWQVHFQHDLPTY